ncbi:MAG: [Fe-Fe] hydrogenase large subunit C-terminal domain-containing protein [Ignavibacteriales bacterium]
MKDELERARAVLRNTQGVGVSIAPSYVCAFPGVSPQGVVAMLASLGFSRIEETASVMPYVIEKRLSQWESTRRPVISTSCPRVVEMVTRDFPGLIENLFRLPSPMVLHTRDMHHRAPGGVVFIGPCSVKLSDARAHPGSADVVLTFDELAEWLDEEGLTPGRVRPMPAHVTAPPWAVASLLAADATGMNACRRFLERLSALPENVPGDKPFIELLACEGGCLGGQGMSRAGDLARRRATLVHMLRDIHL